MTDLVAAGVERREARWLVEEFGGDPVALERARRRRLGGEPLQYVLGHWPFRTLDLNLDERVLVPRPETEELVDVALAELAQSDVVTPLILDAGCGSGAIGLSLLTELANRGVQASLVAIDVSSDALAVARSNALKHDLRAVSFVESDWFDALDPVFRGRFDLIVANPPYVSEGDLSGLDPVLGYEPRRALVAEDVGGVGGFAAVERIIREAPTWLGITGVLVLEHGYDQRDAVLKECDRSQYRDYRDVDDLAGHPRILVARP
ncbi:MAG: peptide chain release factor N(5)-glutamine methyltransferase [Acidimicrobiales bacterium]